jgi:hypothetical protein
MKLDKIVDNNGKDNIGQSNNYNNPLNHMLQNFNHPLPNITFN